MASIDAHLTLSFQPTTKQLQGHLQRIVRLVELVPEERRVACENICREISTDVKSWVNVGIGENK